MKTTAIQTKYGVIYGREALQINDIKLGVYPMSLEVYTRLQLSFCRPKPEGDEPEVDLIFRFTSIQALEIYVYEEFAYEKDIKAAFSKTRVSDSNEFEKYVLCTYDHVFVVTGDYEIIYHQ